MPSMTLDIKKNSDLHKRILNGVRDRVEFSKREYAKRHESWKKAEKRALAYMHEKDIDAERRSERENSGVPHYTTIQVPYTYAALMTAHTYWTTVFLSRDPIMQFSGRHGEAEMQVQALEALMDYQVQVGEMLVPYYIWLLDAGKYGIGIVQNFWDEEVSTVAKVIEEEEMLLGRIGTGRKKKRKVTQRITGYAGNKITNVRPFDWFPDPRVPAYRFQDGEFCGLYTEIGWNTLLERAEQGYYTNLDDLRKRDHGSWGQREEGSGQLDIPGTDSMGFGIDEKKSAEVTKVYECHINLVPNKWGLGKGTLPEKWVFTVTSDYSLVIGAQPLGAIHNKFPFAILEMEPEGYGLLPRGMPEIIEPVQNTMDWLVNTHFYNVRKVLNDQFVVDPSRVVMKDVLDPLPGGIIRLRPQGYGSDTRTAVSQLQVQDITQNHIGNDLQFMFEMGQRTNGVNDQIMGMLSGSGRKSATEIRSSTTFGVNRLKTQAEYMSAMGFGPLASMMVQNSQQYYDAEKKFRIVGDLAIHAGQAFVDVAPETIQGFYDFVPVDGTLPVDRFAQANLWQQLLGQLRNVPQVAQQYDLGKMFAWVAQLAGLKNIHRFKIQVQPDGMLDREAERGNVVEVGGGSAPPRAGLPDLERNRGSQIPGMGNSL